MEVLWAHSIWGRLAKNIKKTIRVRLPNCILRSLQKQLEDGCQIVFSGGAQLDFDAVSKQPKVASQIACWEAFWKQSQVVAKLHFLVSSKLQEKANVRETACWEAFKSNQRSVANCSRNSDSYWKSYFKYRKMQLQGAAARCVWAGALEVIGSL